MRLYEIENNIDFSKYSQAIKLFQEEKLTLYRGQTITTSNEIFERVPTKRKSRNTHNYITTLLSNLPAWKNYPKRNNSWILTTEYNKAGMYGKIYYVFPENNGKIGVCSANDIFISFLRTGMYVNNFNKELHFLSNAKIKMVYNHKTKAYQPLQNRDDDFYSKDEIKLISKYNLSENDYNSIISFLKDNWDTIGIEHPLFPKSYNEFIEKFTPENNGFSLFQLPNYEQYGYRECWTDAKTLFVPEDKIDIIKKLEI